MRDRAGLDEAFRSDRHIPWADAPWQSIQLDSTGGVYVNYLGEEGVKAAYGASYERLRALPAK